MQTNILKSLYMAVGMGVATLSLPSAAIAQQTVPSVAGFDDWSVFETTSGAKECWIASAPTESTASRGGQTVTVRRGEIRMMVTFRPGSNVEGEVSYTGGYTFQEDSRVRVAIGDTNFDLFTEGEWAWPARPADDQALVAAMRAGARAIVTGTSNRGTQTRDVISAIGFTNAFNDARRRCS
ncbi:invasion protein IalB [Rubricella aquisinus]|uniref:Invasion protein IalB n=1 Tax=Rubricella aquisinus TaxID=2028108 RepID=A0A840X547_9RHOB|nr:hypothetical protein [Rubricella aquisinus]MBB5516916.1 invasion protein IalB [Rubricella aquisinus]